ncbi:MAG: hypothetical protein JXX29_09920, partial [Deltaproteobacteria bacterium]|nr:hypothetical protein [Deltaproteobacteria bacterium]
MVPNRIRYLIWVMITGGLLWMGGCAQRGESEILAAEKKHSEKTKATPYTGMLSGYNLNSPTRAFELPAELREASEVTDVSLSTVAMVQDEVGTIFRFDLQSGKVVQEVSFGPPGDYEGMARIGTTMYVLKSNGTLYEVKNWTEESPQVVKHKLQVPAKDNEGLCYDPVTQHLLVSPKSRWKSGKKKQRPVFSVSKDNRTMSEEPVFVLNIGDLLSFAKDHSLAFPTKKKKHKNKVKPDLHFMPASLAVHPVTHDIYMISAVDNVLISFNRKGQVAGFQMLDRKRFPQPEGLAFLSDGTLVIASEAGKRKPMLYTFAWF